MNRPTRIQYVCAVAEKYLGSSELSHLPALMAGFRSASGPFGADLQHSIYALRLGGIDIASEAQLRSAVYDCINWEQENAGDPDYVEPPYEVSQQGPRFRFRRRSGISQVMVDGLLGELLMPVAPEVLSWQVADAARPMKFIPTGGDAIDVINVDLDGFLPPPSPRYDLTRSPIASIDVDLADLLAVARDLDLIDKRDQTPSPGNWVARLIEPDGTWKFELLHPERRGLVAGTRLSLSGVKHLIGLPGTGKSTLIILLLVYMARRCLKTVVLLPSIEASLNLLGELRRYGVQPGLLVGQSPDTRTEHARRLAERIGSDERRGVGVSAPGADLLSLNCALAGFSDEEEAFPHLDPPCTRLRQKRLKKDGTEAENEGKRLCPVAAVCARQSSSRSLIGVDIWLGHILSTDTQVAPHYIDVKLRYFELLARHADLVIVDEADGAQAVLDDKALAALDLTGSAQSFENLLIRDVFAERAGGRNESTAANRLNYGSMAGDLRSFNQRLVAQMQAERKRDKDGGPLSVFLDGFVTGNRVLYALFMPDPAGLSPAALAAQERWFDAVRNFWDGCVATGLRSRSDADGNYVDFDAAALAPLLGVPTADLEAQFNKLLAALNRWLSAQLVSHAEEALNEMRDIMFAVIPPKQGLPAAHATVFFHFLVHVTAVVMQFVAMLPLHQAMAAEGVHASLLYRGGVSEDLAHHLPESLVGRLSGVRFGFRERKGHKELTVSYVSFRGTPRLLLYRWASLLHHVGVDRGPAVLLASATSFLEESPTYHIPVGPDYVLRRNAAADEWRDSVYRFGPIPDPKVAGKMLRYSGTPLDRRDAVLKAMIDHYCHGDPCLIDVMQTDFDTGRRVAFVVNSYAQVRLVKEHIRRQYPNLSARVIGVTDEVPTRHEGDWLTATQVESLGARLDWSALVFPMKSLARGVNIVFLDGPRKRDAMLGTMVFLTRPHPAADSLSFVTGLAGQKTMEFDQMVFPATSSISDISREWRAARAALMADVRRLLRFPQRMSSMGTLTLPYTADIMIDVLQTIGRGMRNGCKVRVIFADAAWAPGSAEGVQERLRSSMLEIMRDILRARLGDPDPAKREIYTALYAPFLTPLEACGNILWNNP